MAGAQILRTTIVKEPTKTELQIWIEWHRKQRVRYEKLRNYYIGDHSILDRVIKINKNANNKALINWCSFITDTLSGYFLSKPIEYKGKDEETLNYLKKINRDNISDDEDYELAKMASIYGHAFEILYYSEDSEIRFNECSPLNTFMLYDINELAEIPRAAIRYQVNTDSSNNKEVIIVQYYTDKSLITYTLDSTYTIKEQKNESHYYNSIPIVEYVNNEERIGDFEKIITLQDAYNIVTSDRTNNVENIVNSLLVIINYAPPSQDEGMKKILTKLKENGLLFIDREGDAKYLSNPLDGSTVENLRKDLKEDILNISSCPNMSDENFSGNSSGISMKYKLWNTEQKTGIKEKKFRTAIYKRLELISLSPKTNNFNWKDIDLVFTRNIPENTIEKIEAASKIYKTISDRAYIQYIAQSLGIEDIEKELKEQEEQKKKAIAEYYPENNIQNKEE